MKVSKEHTDAESPAKGFFIVHQSSGKDFTLFILVACLVKRNIALRQLFSEMGETYHFKAKMKLRQNLEGDRKKFT